MKKRTIFLISILFSLLITGCKYDFIMPVPVEPVPSGVKFSTQVAPIFTTGDKCTACHKPGGTEPSPDFTSANSYANIVPSLVNLTSPDQSKIYTFPAPTATVHTWKTYTSSEAAIILQWITEGAKNN